MLVTIILASVLLMIVAGVAFCFARYLPIITNLFMNITIRRVRGEHEPLVGETVTFGTSDGVMLTGTLTPASAGRPDAPVVVFCHEFTSNRHSATKYGWFLEKAGFRVFSFDFRGHGESGSLAGYTPRQWITEHEMCDLRAAIRYLRSRRDTGRSAIGLFGVSRGAVTAIVVAERDDAVSGVVSDSAFSTSHTLFAYMRRWAPIFVDSRLLVLSAPDVLFSVFRWLAARLAEHRLGVRFTQVMPAIRRLRKPVFLLHGECDTYISSDQARMLHKAAAEPKELWIVPGADHNRAVELQPDEYARRIVDFLRTSMRVSVPVVDALTRT
ncbi:MAG TPA: alpha/beta fold hydrolase [Planctomycetota bacterium]|nr:alpha/beta fold hydrolase [Planctomycetota bacterium]